MEEMKQQIKDMHKILTGNDKPEEGIVFRVAMFEMDIKKYYEEDKGMHKAIWRLLIFFIVLLIANIANLKADVFFGQLLKLIGG